MHKKHIFTMLCASIVSACSPSAQTESKVDPSATVSSIDLHEIEKRYDWVPRGLAWNAKEEKLYLLDGVKGLYVLDRQGKLISQLKITPPEGRTLNDLVFTDTFAATVSDVAGYRLDLETGALEEFFCLEPGPGGGFPWGTSSAASSGSGGAGGMGGSGGSGGAGGAGGTSGNGGSAAPCRVHRNGGLAFIKEMQMLATAPQYFDCDNSAPIPISSELGWYDVNTGEQIKSTVLYGPVFLSGLVWDPVRHDLWSAEGGHLLMLDMKGLPSASGLEAVDYGDIEGLALDEQGRDLWILDGRSERIVHVKVQ